MPVSNGIHENGSVQRAARPLNIVIVGAGIAGLALAGLLGHSGHKVIVLEAAPAIAEVGAGINCSPNLTRLLSRWGLDSRVRQHTDVLKRIDLRRWEDGEFLGAATLMPEVEKRHGAPQYVIHRADLHKALLDDAASVAEIRTASTVKAIDFEKTAVILSNGTKFEADVIVGADGMLTKTKKRQMSPVTKPPEDELTDLSHRNEIHLQTIDLQETRPPGQSEADRRRRFPSVYTTRIRDRSRTAGFHDRADRDTVDGSRSSHSRISHPARHHL